MNTDELSKRDEEAHEDRAEASKRSARHYIQIRGALVQRVDGPDRRSTLSHLVNNRQPRALLLYLMLLYVWPWLQGERLPLEAAAWIRLLHSRKGRTLMWSESTLSRTWAYLAKSGLVERSPGRKSRLKVVPRREDGSTEYTTPSGAKGDLQEAYFTLPDRFWIEEDFAQLNLPGLAVLLVIAKETNVKTEVRMTLDQMAEWYGFSRSTAVAGVRELKALDLLEERIVWIPSRLSKIRTTQETHYSLQGAYSTDARRRARNEANRRRRRAEQPKPAMPTFVEESADLSERDSHGDSA